MIRHTILGLMAAGIFVAGTVAHAAEITTAGQPARLDIRAAGEHSIRVTPERR